MDPDRLLPRSRKHPLRALRTIGPFQTEERLGGGRNGVVYVARDRTGARVALKVVRVAEEAALSSLRREIHALRLIRHPGIVRVIANGMHDGEPWYAMELLEGPTLRERNREWQSTSPRDVLALFRRLCSPLGYLHGEGFVHRDLSPDNVIVREGRAPVITDFGLSSQLRGVEGRDTLAAGGEIVGTLDYIAPEQIYGELVDARADLYALGCMLYESLTGAPPFASPTVAGLLQAHLQEAPEPPSTRVPTLPAGVDELVLGLLEKRPGNRIGYASDVAAALEAAGAPRPEPAGPSARAYVYRPEFHGRRDAVRRLDDALTALAERRGARLFLAGESGIGKTRMATELATRAAVLGFQVVLGESLSVPATTAERAPVRGVAFHPFRSFLQTVSDRCHHAGKEETQRLLGTGARILAAFEPALEDLPGVAQLPSPAPLAEPAARQRLFSHLKQTLAAFAEREPLVLILDDLQWADALSLAFLTYLTPEFLSHHPILIVGTFRTDETDPALDALIEAEGSECMTLDRLDAEAIAAMVRGMLALETPPRVLVDQLARESEGVPFFVSEYLRAAVGEGLLVRDAAGRWAPESGWGDGADPDRALPLPPTLRGLVERRLDHVAPEARRVVDAAACLGREFVPSVLGAMIGVAEDESMPAVVELTRRSVLEEGTGGRLRFVHDKLREAAYERISRNRRIELHRQAGASLEGWMETLDDPRPVYPTLAHQWTMGAVAPKAIEYTDKSGELALGSGAYRDAADFFARLLDLAREVDTPPARVARWNRRQGEALWGMGDLDASEARYTQALATLGRKVPASPIGWRFALVREGTRQAVGLLRSRLGIRSDPGSDPALDEAAMAAARLSRRYFFRGEFTPTIATAFSSVNLADESSAEIPIAELYWQLGYVSSMFHLGGLARGYYDRARCNAERTGDRAGLASTLYAEATHCLIQGHWNDADRLAHESLAALEEMENPQEMGMALTVLGHMDFSMGKFHENRETSRRLLDTARACGNTQHEAWGLYTLGRNALARGELDEAVVLFEEALVLLNDVSDRASDVICRALLGLAHLRRRDLPRALAAAEAALGAARGLLPAVFTMGHGYAALAETYVGLWEARRRGDAGSPDVGAGRTWEAWARLAMFAAIFEIERPSALWIGARGLRVAGRPALARWLANRAHRSARRLAMPHPEARAEWELGLLAPAGSALRNEHLTRARECFRRLGCAFELEELGSI